MGFHGDMNPNPRVEQTLFHQGDGQVAGINFDKYDDIPVECSAGCPEPFNEFTAETVGVQLLKNLVLTKYLKPTPVQKYSLPIGISGGDMMACAQTGSGKTAGFLFPVISMMLRKGSMPEPDNARRGKTSYISALILAPTRELAIQIYDESHKFCYCTGNNNNTLFPFFFFLYLSFIISSSSSNEIRHPTCRGVWWCQPPPPTERARVRSGHPSRDSRPTRRSNRAWQSEARVHPVPGLGRGR